MEGVGSSKISRCFLVVLDSTRLRSFRMEIEEPGGEAEAGIEDGLRSGSHMNVK